MTFDLVGVKCWFAMPYAGFTGASGFDISNPEVGCPLAKGWREAIFFSFINIPG